MSTFQLLLRIEHDPMGCTTVTDIVISANGKPQEHEKHFDGPAEATKAAALVLYAWADVLAAPTVASSTNQPGGSK